MSTIRISKLFMLAGIAIPLAHTDLHGQTTSQSSHAVLWYRSPAPIWDLAVPVGNGRLGAMVFGGANAGKNNGDEQFSRIKCVRTHLLREIRAAGSTRGERHKRPQPQDLSLPTTMDFGTAAG
jgi:Glycosyl hydrolase family 65, N-terminal domain